ncbi:MAG: Hsp70 family protein [Paludibacter sp.]
MSQIKNNEIGGIDLGTTFTEMGFWDDPGQSRIIPNLDGEMKTPSIVYFGNNGNDMQFGNAAESMLFLEPQLTVKEFKRHVGTDKIFFKMNNKEITPEICNAELLGYMRRSAISYFGEKNSLSKAVITVPAYFGEKERQSVRKSAQLESIEILNFVNEPTAAGLAYGLHERQGDFKVLFPDFGGGTYDVSLIQYSGGTTEVLATSGDKNLGGKDIDDALLNLVKEKFKKEHNIEITLEECPGDFYGIWENVIRVKHILASKKEARLIARYAGKQVVIDITVDQLNQLIAPFMDRIKSITLDMIGEAKVNHDEIQHVVFVGGSTRLQAFKNVFKNMFGEDKIVGGSISPDLAVAAGAVIEAIKIVSKSGKTVVDSKFHSLPAPAIQSIDVMSHSLGVAAQDRVSDARFCSVILKKNTTIPCEMSKFYASVNDTQSKFMITVLQGEDNQRIEDCLVVAQDILDLPPRDSSKESIEVSMGYNESGMVKVVVKDLISGKEEDITTDFYSKEK